MRGAADSFGIAVNFYLRTQKVTTKFSQFTIEIPRATHTVENAVGTFVAIQVRIKTCGAGCTSRKDFVNSAHVDRRLNLLIFLSHNRFTVGGVYLGQDVRFEIIKPLLGCCPAIAVEGCTITQTDELQWLALSQRLAGRDSLHADPGDQKHTTLFAKSAVVSNPGLTRGELENYLMWLFWEGPSAPVKYYVGIQLFGGRDSQINANETWDAYAHRDAMWTFQHAGMVDSGVFPEEGIRFIEKLHRSLGARHGANANYADPSLSREEANKLYHGDKLEMLRELKSRFDPMDTFSHPQSIQPYRSSEQD
ncbi:hypothetical protein F5Y08DRAFT_304963 [Xylaria arbuscula]|nr:hypothetical protein F5Y08DRAFT_304963 [Xylaria arbuscula]